MIVIDRGIYPRSEVDDQVVARYADALLQGDVFPPVVVERGTGRLLDGMHRFSAYRRTGVDMPDPEEHDVPPGMTAKLYAAHLQAKHGHPMRESDLVALARELYAAGDEATVAAVARALRQPRQTVEGWLSEERQARRERAEHERAVRQTVCLLLKEAGWSQQQIADHLGISQPLVSQMINNGDSAAINNERVLREAVASTPVDTAGIAETWRQDGMFATWNEVERQLLERHRAGETVVVAMSLQKNLWEWAQAAGVAVRIDRKSAWGNPFILGEDGDRDQVIRFYIDNYWPLKPSLHRRVAELQGKILGCWCHPEPCHGDHLVEVSHSAAG